MKIFQENLAFIDDHNKKAARGQSSFFMKINRFGDLLPHEFSEQMNTFKPHEEDKTFKSSLFVPDSNVSLPDSIDWRDLGAVTEVKNQGRCGSCWAFSTTGALEGQHFRSTGQLISLSEQNLIDCDSDNKGCDGGSMIRAYNFIKNNGGIESESDYPYEFVQQYCRFNPDNVVATVNDYKAVEKNNENDLLEAVGTVGPVSIAVDASLNTFMYYAYGVYSDFRCDPENINHGVLAVGYGNEGGLDYWLVKNSWGNSWGENGYIKIARNAGNMCGVARLATYPVV